MSSRLDDRVFVWGQHFDDQVNYDGNYPTPDAPKGEYRETTIDCHALPPNVWGLFQMHGNVWKWCQDWQGSYDVTEIADPTGPEEGSARVFRGGSWFNGARYARSAFRYGFHPGYRRDYLGFRCLSSASPSGPEAEQVSAAKSAPRDEAAEQ